MPLLTFSVDSLYLAVLSLGVMLYTLWAIRVYPVKLATVVLVVGVPIISFSVLYLLDMYIAIPLACATAGVILFLFYLLVLRFPVRFCIYSVTSLIFYYLFFTSIVSGLLSIQQNKNIYQIMAQPETSRLALLFSSGAFLAYCLYVLVATAPSTMRSIAGSREVFGYLILVESFIALFMLYTCFDYYINSDSIWPSIWHVLSGVIMLALHISAKLHALTTAVTLQTGIHRSRQTELLENQQAHVASLKAAGDITNKLNHRYSEALITLKILAESNQPDKMLVYIDQAQDELRDIRADIKLYSNDSVINSLLFSVSALCQGSAIRFSASLYVPEGLPIGTDDFYSIMQELLKNAVNACGKTPQEKRFIEITSSSKNSWLTITVNNAYSGYVPMSNGIPDIESMSRKAYAGLGLRYVKNVVEANSGVFMCDARMDEHIFTVKIMLPC